jgi:type VI secretion system protein
VPLQLKIRSYHRHSVAQETVKSLGSGALSIGRAPGNNWVLADPERIVSSRHCCIEFAGGYYYLTDTSKNGTFLNGNEEAIGRGGRVELKNGDQIRIGDFIIEAAIVALSEEAAPDAPRQPAPAGRDMPAFLGVPDGAGGRMAHEGLPVGADLPPRTPGPDEGRGTPPDRWRDLERAKPGHEAVPDSVLNDIMRRIAGAAPPPASDEPPPPMTHEVPPLSTNGLATLLEGAGISNLPLDGATEQEVLRHAGALLRACIEGLIETLANRALFKSEFRMDPTVMRASGNNPLKFSTDLETALGALLSRRRQGFRAGTAAVREAYDDIHSHEMAVMASMQVALRAVVRRFDPKSIQAEVESKAGGLSGLVGGRRAQFWDAFCERYKTFEQAIDDDFQKAFGRDLADAYKEHSGRPNRSDFRK